MLARSLSERNTLFALREPTEEQRMILNNYIETIKNDKDYANLSYPEMLLKRTVLWNDLNYIEREPLSEVLYREEDDYQTYNPIKKYIKSFINLDMGNKLNITLFDFLNLTKYEMELLVNILTENLERYNADVELEQKRLIKGIK